MTIAATYPKHPVRCGVSIVTTSTKGELTDWLIIILGMIAIAIAVAVVIAILKADATFLFAR